MSTLLPTLGMPGRRLLLLIVGVHVVVLQAEDEDEREDDAAEHGHAERHATADLARRAAFDQACNDDGQRAMHSIEKRADRK